MTIINQAHLQSCTNDHDRIRVGATDYRIDRKNHTEMDGAFGRINTSLSVLEVLDGIGEQAYRITLWHETLHAILYAAGYNEHDEQLVEALAHGIVQALRDNDCLHP